MMNLCMIMQPLYVKRISNVNMKQSNTGWVFKGDVFYQNNRSFALILRRNLLYIPFHNVQNCKYIYNNLTYIFDC